MPTGYIIKLSHLDLNWTLCGNFISPRLEAGRSSITFWHLSRPHWSSQHFSPSVLQSECPSQFDVLKQDLWRGLTRGKNSHFPHSVGGKITKMKNCENDRENKPLACHKTMGSKSLNVRVALYWDIPFFYKGTLVTLYFIVPWYSNTWATPLVTLRELIFMMRGPKLFLFNGTNYLVWHLSFTEILSFS